MPRASVRLRAVPELPPRAVAYLRQSIAREESISLELQETACRDYAARRGYQIVEVVADPGISGRTWARPGVQRVMAMVEAREVDVVLLWRWSRLSRSRRDWALAADRVEVAGGRIESATEPVDVTTSTGRLTRGMLTELAAWESDVKSEQWKEAQARRLRMGLPHNGGARFGYLYDRATGYLPDPDTAPILADLYARYVAGEGFQQLAISLNRAGVATMRGGRWTPTTLLRQLDSGFAAGLLQTGTRKGIVEHQRGAHPPLIDEATWSAYQAQRDRLRRMPPRARHPVYPLTGLVRHGGDCGAALSVWSKPDRRGVVQRGYLYRCIGWVVGTCPGLWVKRETVEARVLAEVATWAGDVDARAATKTARVAARAVVKADRSRLVREQARLDRALSRLAMQQAVDEAMPASAYVSARDELVAQQRHVAEQLAATVADEQSLGIDVGQLRGLLRDWVTLAPADRRDLLAKFVRRVEVSRVDKELHVVVVPISRVDV